jgi:hypothetical protein
MSKPLRVLILEDHEVDAELVLLELHRGGYAAEWERVWTPEAFRSALRRKRWEVILSDYQMPRFTALAALEILHAERADIPFILVSGSVGEAVAVEAMRAGARDFFPKTNLTRLTAAIGREVAEAQVRRERKQAVEQLRQAEERYRLVIEHVLDYAIFYLDPAGRVATWSPGAQRIFGYEHSEISGQSLDLFYPGEERERAAQALARSRTGGSVHEEGWIVRRGGDRFWAERSFEVIQEGGLLRGYAAIIRDVSERKRLMDDLRLAIQARDDFLSIASHELKTPLTSLQLQVDSLQSVLRKSQEQPLRPETLERKTDIIHRQSYRLMRLVESLLDVTRIVGGRVVLHLEEVDLSLLVQDYVGQIHEMIRRAGSSVTVTARGPVVGMWDRLKLEGVLHNLLDNALKYGAGKPIEISVERHEGKARLSVTDHGFGIPPEAQSRIFERFERAVPKKHYGGLGIGLWIVRQAVEAHGGSVHVVSEEGKGATFTVLLPLGA